MSKIMSFDEFAEEHGVKDPDFLACYTPEEFEVMYDDYVADAMYENREELYNDCTL